jgi:RNA recognition motif-containing protein
MIVMLRRIPANTKKHDVFDFIEPALKGGLLKKSGRIEDINILIFKDTQTMVMEYHCLVTIDSNAVAYRVIKKLNRKPFKGKRITVREYFPRSWHNDPRINQHEWNEELVDKRQADRRRPKLEVVEDISDKFSSSKGFHRTL